MSHIQFFYIYGALYNKVGHILLKKPYLGLFGGVLAVMLSHGIYSVEGTDIWHYTVVSRMDATPFWSFIILLWEITNLYNILL